MKRGLATLVLGGILCMFAKIGVIQINGDLPYGAYGGEFPYRTQGGSTLFRAGIDVYASDCGYDCTVSPWQYLQIRDGQALVKICASSDGGHTLFALDPRKHLVAAYDKE